MIGHHELAIIVEHFDQNKTMTPITFFVPGLPKPAGSKRAFCLKKGGVYTGRAIVTDDCKKSSDWKNDVRQEAMKIYQGPLLDGPIELTLVFTMPRPKFHYGTGKNASVLKLDAPYFHIIKPDSLKLARGVEDALTNTILKDDCLIVAGHNYKVYGSRPGVHIFIRPAVRLTVQTILGQIILEQ